MEEEKIGHTNQELYGGKTGKNKRERRNSGKGEEKGKIRKFGYSRKSSAEKREEEEYGRGETIKG